MSEQVAQTQLTEVSAHHYNNPQFTNFKGCEEDEYTSKRLYREREKLKTRLHADVEWPSEPQGEREYPVA